MRSADYFVGAALVFGLVGTATAQTSPAPTAATTQPTTYGETVSHWLASGFVGGGFGTQGDVANIDENAGGPAYGAQVGYLWKGMVGPEFLVDWAPSFDVSSAFIPGDTHLITYMANAIGAIPLGADGQVVPFVSGGFGSIQAAADVLSIDGTTHSNSNAQWGTNIGGGLMAFTNNRVGLRGDLRYYHAFKDTNFNGSAPDQLMESIVSGLDFWRATGGVSVRW
jgi:hypothetical protein